MRKIFALASISIAVLSLAACGDDGGGGGVDGPSGQHITVMGTAETVNGTSRVPLEGAAIAAYNGTSTTPVAMTTSAADGTYTLTLDSNGSPIDGYVKATSATRLDTYLYPPRPLTADTTGATLLVVTQGTIDLIVAVGTATQTRGKGLVGVLVRDPQGNPVSGATVTISPMGAAAIRYAAGASGIPNANANATDSNGLAYIFNTDTGTVTIGASVGGTAYHAHALEARADVVTTTAVEP